MEVARPIIRTPVIKQRSAIARMKQMKSYLPISDVQMFNHDFTPVIQCRVGQYNHFKGQVYDKDKSNVKLVLASEHWNSTKTIGDYFTIMPFGHSPHEHNYPSSSFADFVEPRLDAQLIRRLRACGFIETSFVQYENIPKLLNGGCNLIVADTGSGKTLVYLVTLLNQVLFAKSVEDTKQDEQQSMRRRGSPLAIIVSPSRDLAAQIHKVATKLIGSQSDSEGNSSSLDIQCHLLGGVHSRSNFASAVKQSDILIGTPGTLSQLCTDGQVHMNHVNHVVLDEVDTLLDDTFESDTSAILSRTLGVVDPGREVQLTMMSATLPRNLDDKLGSFLHGDHEISRTATKRVHTVPQHIKQTFIRTAKVARSEYLLDILSECLGPNTSKTAHSPVRFEGKVKRIIVFNNKTSTAVYIAKLLAAHNYRVLEFHGGLNLADRYRNLELFMNDELHVGNVISSQSGCGPVVLSCTDLASRGLDTTSTDMVVNYEFPLNMSDYLHRIGRVGRIGSPEHSQVVNFVGGFVPVELTQQIERAVRLQQELPHVDSNIIRIIRQRAKTRKSREAEYRASRE